MRGQLVDAPGYMSNYALGAILTEALRARVVALRGETAFEAPSPELYRWLSQQLYRFGLAEPSRNVVEAFLGGPLTAEPFLTLLAAMRGEG
jgi:Zn-dependent M32 family carboxypeptidase